MPTPEITPLAGLQKEVESHLKELQPLIELANLQIEQAYLHDKDNLINVMNQVIEELDAEWPYMNDEFSVIGKWYSPHIAVPQPPDSARETDDDSDDTDGNVLERHPSSVTELPILITVNQEDVMSTALSKGFVVSIQRDVPQIAYWFERPGYASVGIPGFMELDITRHAQAFPDEVSIEYVRSLSSEAPTENSLMAISDALDLSESLHQLYISEPNFYRLKPHRQMRVMQELLDRVNSLIAQTGEVTIQTEVAWTFLTDTQDLRYEHIDHEEEFLILRGKLAGVGLINGLQFEKGVRSPDELEADVVGLYLDIVDLEEPTPPMIIERKVAHAVFGSVRNISLSL